MFTPMDQFIDNIEKRKKQLDGVVEAYKLFKQRLSELPEDLATEAAQMLSSSGETLGVSQDDAEPDLLGKTALECVEIILNERRNAPMHFAAFARESLLRGYRGRSSGSAEEVQNRTANSFWAAMSRSPYLEPVGKGRYRLRNFVYSGQSGANNEPLDKAASSDDPPAEPLNDDPPAEPPDEFDASQLPRHRTLGVGAATVLKDAEIGMKLKDIVTAMVERGYWEARPDKQGFRNLCNAVFTAMTRAPNVFVRLGHGLWGLRTKQRSLDFQP